MPITVITPRVRRLEILQRGTRVLVVEGGELIFDLSWDVALRLSSALRQQAKRAEEQDKASQVANDQAVLDAAGVPIALSDRRDILNEARRINGLPSIKSREMVGAPTIIQHSRRTNSENL